MKDLFFIILLLFLFALTGKSQNNLTFSLPNCSGNSDASYINPDQISACYNPQTNEITVEIKGTNNPSENIRVELYSVLGLSIYNKSFTKSTFIDIPVKDFKKGMYVIVVSDDKNSVKKRILVN